MSDVHVIGFGHTPVTQGEAPAAGRLASQAVAHAVEDADVHRRDVSALYLGNMSAGLLEGQQQLASLCAHALSPKDLAPFAITAHENGLDNPDALLRTRLDMDRYLSSRDCPLAGAHPMSW